MHSCLPTGKPVHECIRLTDTLPKPAGSDIQRLTFLAMIGNELDEARDIANVAKVWMGLLPRPDNGRLPQ